MIRSDRTAETCPSQLCVSSHCGIKFSSKRDWWGGEVQKQTELLGLQFFSLLVLCLQVSNRRSSSSEKADSVKGGLKGRHQIGWSERLQPPSDEVPCLNSFFTDRLLHWLNVWWCLCNLNDPQCNRSEAIPGMSARSRTLWTWVLEFPCSIFYTGLSLPDDRACTLLELTCQSRPSLTNLVSC